VERMQNPWQTSMEEIRQHHRRKIQQESQQTTRTVKNIFDITKPQSQLKSNKNSKERDMEIVDKSKQQFYYNLSK